MNYTLWTRILCWCFLQVIFHHVFQIYVGRLLLCHPWGGPPLSRAIMFRARSNAATYFRFRIVNHHKKHADKKKAKEIYNVLLPVDPPSSSIYVANMLFRRDSHPLGSCTRQTLARLPLERCRVRH